MSTRIEELEAGLRESFDRGQLAVYADALQAQGDPRGELIALDLECDAGSPSDELVARRRELLHPCVPDHAGIRCRHGFVDVVDAVPTPLLDTLLLGPFGRYLRSLTIAASAKDIRCVAMTLALHRRPWLEQLTIAQVGWGSVQLPSKLATRLVLALPRLKTLRVTGTNVFPLVPLPTVEQLTATPIGAVAALTALPLGGYLPAVTALDTTLIAGYRPGLSHSNQHAALPRSQLPALRSLDLSRTTNIPANSGIDVFRFVAQLEVASQLRELRLPALQHVEQAVALQGALDRMPDLQRLTFVGGRLPNIRLDHPAQIVTA
jgi:hypothetical protein